jgi:hypothetical protein
MQRELTATSASNESKQDAAGSSIGTWTLLAMGLLAGSLLLITVLGYFTSAMFNLHLGITRDFASEGLTTYAALGAQNLVPTVFYMGVAVALYYVAAVVAKLASTAVPPLRRYARVIAETYRTALQRLNLEDTNAMAKLVCAGGAVVFGVIVGSFRQLLVGVTSSIDDAPLGTLAILNPAYEGTHDLYGLSLDMLLLLLLLALFQLLRRKERPTIGPVVGMTALAGLALLFHAGAWRIMYRDEFRQALFENQICYVLGRNAEELLVHCPHGNVPRNRVINQEDSRLQFTGRVEQVSSAFTIESSQKPQ